jgi:hypothetical protein
VADVVSLISAGLLDIDGDELYAHTNIYKYLFRSTSWLSKATLLGAQITVVGKDIEVFYRAVHLLDYAVLRGGVSLLLLLCSPMFQDRGEREIEENIRSSSRWRCIVSRGYSLQHNTLPAPGIGVVMTHRGRTVRLDCGWRDTILTTRRRQGGRATMYFNLHGKEGIDRSVHSTNGYGNLNRVVSIYGEQGMHAVDYEETVSASIVGYGFTVIPYDEVVKSRILSTSRSVVRVEARDWSRDYAQSDAHIEAYAHYMGNKVAFTRSRWIDSTRDR